MRNFGVEQFGIFALCSTVILLSDTILAQPDLAVLRLAPLEHERDKPALAWLFKRPDLFSRAGMGMLFCWALR